MNGQDCLPSIQLDLTTTKVPLRLISWSGHVIVMCKQVGSNYDKSIVQKGIGQDAVGKKEVLTCNQYIMSIFCLRVELSNQSDTPVECWYLTYWTIFLQPCVIILWLWSISAHYHDGQNFSTYPSSFPYQSLVICDIHNLYRYHCSISDSQSIHLLAWSRPCPRPCLGSILQVWSSIRSLSGWCYIGLSGERPENENNRMRMVCRLIV